MVAALAAAALPVVVGNPQHIRACAQAVGILANTDRLDARVIAHGAAAVKPAPRPLPDALLPSGLRDEPGDVQRDAGRPQDPIHLALPDLGEGRLCLCLRLYRLLDQHDRQAARRLTIPSCRHHARGIVRIIEEQDPVQTRNEIPKQFEALWAQINVQTNDARDVAAGPVETLDQAHLHGIATQPSEDNRDAGGHHLCRFGSGDL